MATSSHRCFAVMRSLCLLPDPSTLSPTTVGCYSFITWRISPLRSERCTADLERDRRAKETQCAEAAEGAARRKYGLHDYTVAAAADRPANSARNAAKYVSLMSLDAIALLATAQ